MRTRVQNNLILIVFVILLCGVAYALFLSYKKELLNPNYWTGWTLLGLIFLLSSYNLYKKFPQFRLGRSSTWLYFHTYFGIFAFFMYLLHTEFSWPNGWLESTLGYCFIIQSILGACGLAISRYIPPSLAIHGESAIYERIPQHITKLRNRAEKIILEAVSETGSSSISDFYIANMARYLNRPNNKLAHIFGRRKPLYKLLSKTDTFYRYLSDNEKLHMDKIMDIVHAKNNLDFQYARQGLLKHWLFIHIPISGVLILLALTHLVIVYSFTGGGA